MIKLTEEEEKEFTLLNLLAFDLRRSELAKKDTISPCWLCMSEEAKEECRRNLIEYGSVARFLERGQTMTREWLERRLQAISASLQPNLNLWREAELEYKRLREEEHNPRAFFAG